jgi:hypothetical protein
MLGGFINWLVYGPDGEDESDGFTEADMGYASNTRQTSSSEHEHHGAIRRSVSQKQKALERSGGGLIDLQCGRRVFNDVPANMRTELWLSKLHSSQGRAEEMMEFYKLHIHDSIDASVSSEIEKDMHRTFPGHVTLSSPAGQQAMYNVLHAYAALDPEVGYSQGMNFVAGIFLTYLSPPEAFTAFVLVMQERGLRDFYKPNGMQHLQARLWQLNQLIPSKLRDYMEERMVLPVLYASGWLLTCFASEFPIKFSARVMDVMITDSYDLPMMKVAFHILSRWEDDILKLEDMEEIVDLLRKTIPSLPESTLQDLLTTALGPPWSDAQIELLRSLNNPLAETVDQAVRRIGDHVKEESSQNADDEDQTDHNVISQAGGKDLLSFENDTDKDLIDIKHSTSSASWVPEWTDDDTQASSDTRKSPHDTASDAQQLMENLHISNAGTAPQVFESPFSSSSIASRGKSSSNTLQTVSSSALSLQNRHSSTAHEWPGSYQNSMRQLLSKFSSDPTKPEDAEISDQLRDWIMSQSINWNGPGEGRPAKKKTDDSASKDTQAEDDDFGEWVH